MKGNKKCRIAAIVLLAAGILALAVFMHFRKGTEGIQETGVSTGTMNACLAYDADSGIMIVGTAGSNQLMAFKGTEQIWTADAVGAFCDIEINSDENLVIAGNQDNHVYLYSLTDGTPAGNIDVQRRIVAVDANKDVSRIAVATLTGTSKANAILVDREGNQISSTAYKVKIGGIAATEDGLILGNNRGELIRQDGDGKQTAQEKTNYTVIQMVNLDGLHLALCKDGSYYFFDDELNITRQGRIENTVQATPSCIGTDASHTYVAVGSSEGYLFILDGNDRQVYSTDIGIGLSDFTADGSSVLVTGSGDFVKKVNVANLGELQRNIQVTRVSMISWILLLAAGVFTLFLSFEKTGSRMRKLGKTMWRQRTAYILLLPTFILVWMFNYRGIFTAFIRAFTDWSLVNNTVAKMSFVGFDNFKRMVTEGYFLVGMKNLLMLIVSGTVKVLTIPVLCAWLVFNANGSRRKYIHRFLFVLPIVVPGVISAMVWLKIYDPNIGLINEFLKAIGHENWTRVWLGNSKTAMWAVIFMGFPWINAMAFLVYYGGLLGIGKDVEESAVVDGATRHDIFWKIQVPLLKPQFRVMVMLTLIGEMQNFNNIYILTQGGPGTSTYVPALELYFNVAQFGRYGYACALGVMLFVCTMTVTLLNNFITREKEV